MSDAVFLHYDRAALDAQYDNRAKVADAAGHIARYQRLSEQARRDLECSLDVPFGPSPAETVDVFPAGDGAPVRAYVASLNPGVASIYKARLFYSRNRAMLLAVAAVVLAALINALKITGKDAGKIRTVISGAGAAGLAGGQQQAGRRHREQTTGKGGGHDR